MRATFLSTAGFFRSGIFAGTVSPRYLRSSVKPLLRLALILLAMAETLTAETQATPDETPPRMGLEEAKKRGFVLYAPHPVYPYSARVRHEIGSGAAQLRIDENTGLVQSVVMSPSTGSAYLDQSTTDTFRRWKFRPHGLTHLRVPITYTMAGVSFTLQKQEQSFVEMLAPYLGSGTLSKAPAPTYPVSQSWSYKHGKGVYELEVDPSGHVTDVRILQSSGDEIFDRTVRKTLLKWQLTRGPLVVEIPLSFALTPNSYRLDVAR